jgi:hypothetical protein
VAEFSVVLDIHTFTDAGTSQLIVDGKIKFKNDSPIERFTPTGIRFENGTELVADVVVFATGYSILFASAGVI